MSEPLSLSERMQMVAKLDARVTRNPAPHPSLPATPGPGSNVAYVSKEENARLVQQALALGLGTFARLSADDTHRLAAQMQRKRA